jgi:hypothetical protein
MCKTTTTTTTTTQSTSINDLKNPSSAKADAASSSGFDRNKLSIEIGLLLLSVVYGSVYYLNPNIPVSASHCEEGVSSCLRPDLIAYKVASTLCMTYMASKGVYEWHWSKALSDMAPNNKQRTSSAQLLQSRNERLFAHLSAADAGNVVIFCYQVWDFAVSLTIPEYCQTIFLFHHVLTSTAAFLSLEYQMVPYYSIYFGGCSEVSSMFLILCDLDSLLAVDDDALIAASSSSAIIDIQTLETFFLVFKVMFALTFTYCRVFRWLQVSRWMWKDGLGALKPNEDGSKSETSHWCLYIFLALNFVLSSLQIYWFVEICQLIAAM